MRRPRSATHCIVLPGGGYAAYAENEAMPIADWLGTLGIRASVFRYPLLVRHPEPLDALRGDRCLAVARGGLDRRAKRA